MKMDCRFSGIWLTFVDAVIYHCNYWFSYLCEIAGELFLVRSNFAELSIKAFFWWRWIHLWGSSFAFCTVVTHIFLLLPVCYEVIECCQRIHLLVAFLLHYQPMLLTVFAIFFFSFTTKFCTWNDLSVFALLFLLHSSKRRGVKKLGRLWHRWPCNQPCKELYPSLAENNTPLLLLCQSHPVGRQWNHCLVGAPVVLAEMLRLDLYF